MGLTSEFGLGDGVGFWATISEVGLGEGETSWSTLASDTETDVGLEVISVSRNARQATPPPIKTTRAQTNKRTTPPESATSGMSRFGRKRAAIFFSSWVAGVFMFTSLAVKPFGLDLPVVADRSHWARCFCSRRSTVAWCVGLGSNSTLPRERPSSLSARISSSADIELALSSPRDMASRDWDNASAFCFSFIEFHPLQAVGVAFAELAGWSR